jgi:hypothetical protein
MALRMHGPNTSANRSMRMGPDNGKSHDAQFQMLLHLFQEFLSPTCDLVLQLLNHISDYSRLTYNTLCLRKGKSPPFSAVSKSNPLWFWRTTDARESSWSCIVIMDLATSSTSFVSTVDN